MMDGWIKIDISTQFHSGIAKKWFLENVEIEDRLENHFNAQKISQNFDIDSNQ